MTHNWNDLFILQRSKQSIIEHNNFLASETIEVGIQVSRPNWGIHDEDVFDGELCPVSHRVYFHPQICVSEFFELVEEGSNQIRMDPGQNDGYQEGENLQEHVEILTSDLDNP